DPLFASSFIVQHASVMMSISQISETLFILTIPFFLSRYGIKNMLTDERSLNVQHYLDHECFILGGCMMANMPHVHQGRCHISFV
ncbi:hypothetical protein MJN76_31920, partial [Salmonella enterica subsp. enterica serovar Anatum]|nr:hypothetical protein [Salmonella enterica subsp. enterica serovar Anatum]